MVTLVTGKLLVAPKMYENICKYLKAQKTSITLIEWEEKGMFKCKKVIKLITKTYAKEITAQVFF